MLKRRGENLAYHAARLLLLIALCGKPRGKQAKMLPGIEGRTLLAKLDFFLRYPLYLKKAAVIEGRAFELTDEDYGMRPEVEAYSIESRMVRYLYGPWDHVYYPALAYLIGKGLITVDKKGRTEVFRITPAGIETAERIAGDESSAGVKRRHVADRNTGNYILCELNGTKRLICPVGRRPFPQIFRQLT